MTLSADPDCVSRKKPPKNAPFARIRLRLSSPCGRKWGPDGGPFWQLSHDSVDGIRLLKSKMGPFFTALVDGLRLRKSERNPVSTAALSRNRLPKPQRGVKKTARPHFRSRCRRMPTAKAEKRHEKTLLFRERDWPRKKHVGKTKAYFDRIRLLKSYDGARKRAPVFRRLTQVAKTLTGPQIARKKPVRKKKLLE